MTGPPHVLSTVGRCGLIIVHIVSVPTVCLLSLQIWIPVIAGHASHGVMHWIMQYIWTVV
ncbi:hypothetical protein BS50DRAFT_580256, partial [Corynespora cassiicola Philippines]